VALVDRSYTTSNQSSIVTTVLSCIVFEMTLSKLNITTRFRVYQGH